MKKFFAKYSKYIIIYLLVCCIAASVYFSRGAFAWFYISKSNPSAPINPGYVEMEFDYDTFGGRIIQKEEPVSFTIPASTKVFDDEYFNKACYPLRITIKNVSHKAQQSVRLMTKITVDIEKIWFNGTDVTTGPLARPNALKYALIDTEINDNFDYLGYVHPYMAVEFAKSYAAYRSWTITDNVNYTDLIVNLQGDVLNHLKADIISRYPSYGTSTVNSIATVEMGKINAALAAKTPKEKLGYLLTKLEKEKDWPMTPAIGYTFPISYENYFNMYDQALKKFNDSLLEEFVNNDDYYISYEETLSLDLVFWIEHGLTWLQNEEDLSKYIYEFKLTVKCTGDRTPIEDFLRYPN